EIEKAEKEYLRLGDPIRLGRLNLMKNNYNKAIEYFDEALKKIIQSRNAEFLFADYSGLGEGYLGLKNYQKAKENYEKAITLTEEQREGLGEGEKSKFFSAKVHGFPRTQPYEGMVRSLIALNQNNDAFFYSENLKARVLAEAIAKAHSSTIKTLPKELAKEEENYITKIRGLRKQMEVLYRNKAMDTYYEKENELKTVKAEQEKFITKLRRLYPEYASINYPQPIKPSEVKLNKNEVLIEYEITDEKLYAFLLKDGKIDIRGVSISRKELQELVLKYRNYFESTETRADFVKYDPKIGKKLHSILIGTMLDNIPEGTSIIIVPDEILGILPFEALVTALPEKEKIGEGEFGPFPLGVKYLGDKYSITYAQSATSLTLLRSLKKEKSTQDMALAVCDPIFSRNDKRVSQLAKADINKQTDQKMGAIKSWKMGVAGIREKGARTKKEEVEEETFFRLEKTTEIANGMEALFGNKATILIGSEAKEEDVLKLPFSKYKYITFATHGILDKTIPYIQEPALVLTQVGNSEGYDGFLTMSEVMGLKMPAEVVALTACQTGVGKQVSGEGVMGMGRAFQYAGAGNVLMSLWSVYESATVALTNAFFKNLKEGKEPKEALRLARQEIRRKGYEHPVYWSAFILVSK
ncbi:MAG: CHAT domain-containing protein, partial [Candidatus Ratteibacteria bacterium]